MNLSWKQRQEVNTNNKIRNYGNVLDTQTKLLALEWDSELFETYFCKRHSLTRTDHSAVQWLRILKNTKIQVARWLEWLSGFDLEVEHHPSSFHNNADGLPQLPWSEQ